MDCVANCNLLLLNHVTINTSSNILKRTMPNAGTILHSVPWSVLVRLCDLSEKIEKCVKTTLRGVNIIRSNEATQYKKNSQ